MNIEDVLREAKKKIGTGPCIIEAIHSVTTDFDLAKSALVKLYKAANLLDERCVVKRGGLVGWQKGKSVKQIQALFDKAIQGGKLQ